MTHDHDGNLTPDDTAPSRESLRNESDYLHLTTRTRTPTNPPGQHGKVGTALNGLVNKLWNWMTGIGKKPK